MWWKIRGLGKGIPTRRTELRTAFIHWPSKILVTLEYEITSYFTDKLNRSNSGGQLSSPHRLIFTRGQNWDSNPLKSIFPILGLGSGSIFQNFRIKIGIDFSKFWNLDWNRFFKILELGSIFQNFGIEIIKPGHNPKKSQESQEISGCLGDLVEFFGLGLRLILRTFGIGIHFF